MSVRRVMGMETEFGIIEPGNAYANPIVLSSQIVQVYGAAGDATSTAGAIPWDFHGEDPLNDARGYRLERAAAHPSQLTDNPDELAPTGDVSDSFQASPWPRDEQLTRPRAANAVLTNGARLYVDHAHPEYSAPEVINPREAVLYDRAGEVVMAQAMDLARERENVNLRVYKNNVDGKGAAYGSHENYTVARSLEFDEIIRYMTAFFVTRPILCGAGRVGLGQKSEEPGFQISQRADYVENDVGLETTFNRPIINTRDEPHADSALYRRYHVIGGDANLFDVSNLLKVGTTSLVLWLLERGEVPLELDSVILDNPVVSTWIVSQDPSLKVPLEMADGRTMTALEIQQVYLDVVRSAVEATGECDFDTAEVLRLWQEVLDTLRTDLFAAAGRVEWVAKLKLLTALRQRGNLAWNDDKLRAIDLQWHDLRPEASLVAKLDQAGQVERIFSHEEVAYAATHAPISTRAFMRGELIRRFGKNVVAAGWDGIILDVPGRSDLVRIPTLHPDRATQAYVGTLLEKAETIEDFLHALLAA